MFLPFERCASFSTSPESVVAMREAQNSDAPVRFWSTRFEDVIVKSRHNMLLDRRAHREGESVKPGWRSILEFKRARAVAGTGRAVAEAFGGR